MNKFKARVTFLGLFILAVFFISDTLMAFDIHGYGSAVWGDSKARIKGRYSRKLSMGSVKFITETPNLLVVDYYGQKIRQKRYEFFKDGLVKIFVYYNNPERRTMNTYRQKYGSPALIDNVYVWKFPSTIITHKPGSQRMVFTDASYTPPATVPIQTAEQPGPHNIDKIQVGMTTEEVKNLMGDPVTSAVQMGGILYYRYSTGIITFKDGKVIRITKGASGPKKVTVIKKIK